MPQFFFKVCDDPGSSDAEGSEHPDIGAARLAAIRHASEVIRDEARHIAASEPWHMEIRDADGRALFQIRLEIRPCASDAGRSSEDV